MRPILSPPVQCTELHQSLVWDLMGFSGDVIPFVAIGPEVGKRGTPRLL